MTSSVMISAERLNLPAHCRKTVWAPTADVGRSHGKEEQSDHGEDIVNQGVVED
ncbi:hypothetical protein ACX80D_11355 [Arthrobacter sp. Sr24]